MPIVNPKGRHDYWLDGTPIEGLPPKDGIKVENSDYWLDGAPFAYIIPSGDTDFMEFFWGIG